MGLITLIVFAATILRWDALAQDASTKNISIAFKQWRIVPDVLSVFNPTGVLHVTFTDPLTRKKIAVTPGMHLTQSQTANQPIFQISSLPPSFAPRTFVVAMIDPDAPSPADPTSAQWLHMLGGDFSLFGQHLVNTTSMVVNYTGPSPPSWSPPHRYVILVYEQPTIPRPSVRGQFKMLAAPFINSTSRSEFDIVSFAKATKLTGPMAGTFFFVGSGREEADE